ncbi:MAG: putative lipoprotein precursor [Daejeonella sp.]|nr:putative lipoprotein precursor [Daejeonella sp.]
MKKILSAYLICIAVFVSCKKESATVVEPPPVVVVTPPLETIRFSSNALYPEGIAYDSGSSSFLVSSISTGTIGKVDLKGTYSAFITDSKLISTLGIQVDSIRNRVLIAVGDLKNAPAVATRDNMAAVGIYNLKTGAPLAFVNLGQLKPGVKHLANDIAVDVQGNAYVTDSFSPIIYKIDMNNDATIFLENDAFKPLHVGDMAGLNGIVFHPDGYLIASKMDTGELFKIPLTAPNTFTKITSVALPGDGLLLTKDKKLVVMAPTLNKAHLVSSTNAWTNATVEKTYDTGDVWATTLTLKGNDIFGLYTYDVQATPANSFAIQKIKF